MTLDERLENVSVIGAGGKMGSGIAALLQLEMAKLKLKEENRERIYRLNLIDVSEKALDGLKGYLKAQFQRHAEKSIVLLRDSYKDRKDVVENAEVVQTFVDEAFNLLNFSTELDIAKKSQLVFEAIIEDEKAKIKLLKQLKKMCPNDTYFFTNTSSIPIGFLDEGAGLNGKIIGYHFYNPPVVQRLVEVISAKSTVNELKEIGTELGKRLKKTLVWANDISGFIGNGHFMRDGLYGLNLIDELRGKFKFCEAIYAINRITQHFLLRPMGIFQLIDYVGIDVFQCILKVMRNHLKDQTLKHRLIDKMVKLGIRGGQRPDGSQKDGFLKYEKNRPVGIFDIRKGEYISITDDWREKIDKKIGPLPEGFLPWKTLLSDAQKDEKLERHFRALKDMNTLGAEISREYLRKTKEIAENLVKQKVANSSDDVNAVLTNGFYWLYGPINNYT